MKYSKILTALMVTVSAAASAQEGIGARYDNAMKDYHPRFGIEGGGGASNLTIDDAGTVNDKKAVGSWHLGMYVDVPLFPVLSVQGGVQVIQKGSKFTTGSSSGETYTEVSTRPIYVEIPLNAVVKIPLPNKVRLFAGAGPYVAMGVGGKNKLEGKFLGTPYSNEDGIQFNSDNNSSTYNADLKRFDAGLNFLAGLEIGHFTLNANYGYGLANIKSGSNNNDSKYANRVYSLSVGFLF